MTNKGARSRGIFYLTENFIKDSLISKDVKMSKHIKGIALCEKCKNNRFITIIGTCPNCGCGVNKEGNLLCADCAKQSNSCSACKGPLAPIDLKLPIKK